ncbi:pentatricopeptide repeat-containing protein At2g20540 [Pistacia vera]|uniref:pentatricopeptide repeat-containing protein At2g20540 n=1 Tax=Pistacia vera TaxID=55513 RepID=UPI001263794E|nr:pentatricopeptide repeat-containing protein At2g20540 [Pistacia vera]
MVTRVGVLTIKELEDLFVPLLQNCINVIELKKIHGGILKYSLTQSNFLVTKMVDVCDNGGDLEYASLLFKQVNEPNVFLYNAMIRAYTHNHTYGLAVDVYKQMLRDSRAENPILPDKFTFPFLIKSCAGLMCYLLAKQVHAHVCKFGPKSHSITENALIDMYTKCDDLIEAQKVFEQMTERDVISWNTLISGHVRLGQMKKARSLFDKMPYRTIVSWTAMISGYSHMGCHADALDVFQEMQTAGIEPDDISIVSVLPACAQLGALEFGKWIHMYCDRNGLLRKTCICNALIEMYAKCGCISQARQLFELMLEKDVISWSTMIGGLANHGKAREAIQLFQEMLRANVEPNGVTFLGILSACSHAGFWNEGLSYFDSMRKDYQIEPKIEHYGCLVDLLGRAGRLRQALDIIEEMPMKPDSKTWGSLLSSCRTHSNLEIAVIAMEHLLELEPEDTGNYVLLSNIYADLGKWEAVSKMRKLIRSQSIKKTPGCSLIEVNNEVQEFVSGDDTKPFSEDIFCLLELLALHQDRTKYLVDIMPEDASE